MHRNMGVLMKTPKHKLQLQPFLLLVWIEDYICLYDLYDLYIYVYMYLYPIFSYFFYVRLETQWRKQHHEELVTAAASQAPRFHPSTFQSDRGCWQIIARKLGHLGIASKGWKWLKLRSSDLTWCPLVWWKHHIVRGLTAISLKVKFDSKFR